MFYLCIFLSLLSVLGFHSTVRGQLNETAFTSDAQCYGDELVVNATCPLLSSIALNNIRVGTRPNANGCHGNETTGDGTGCCQSSSDACEFDFPISDSVHFYDQCNRGQLCRPGVEKIDVIHGSCNASVYPVFTNYMYFDYFCIEDSRISHMDLGHFTVEDAALYLQSTNYTTSNISSSVSELSCSVETRNCNAVILIYVIERNLAGVMNCTQCNQTQSLSIIEEDGSTLVNWSSKDNTYTISQPLQTAGSYILVNFTNIMTTDGGKFWIGFQASLPTNLTLECPAIEKQYCFPSTTRSTTTTSTTSRSMTTRMTTSKHSSLDTQKTGTAFPTVSSIINTTHRDNNGGNTNNISSIPANLTLACPAVDKQYCFPTTTTPNTSTTTTTPSTTSTTTSSTTTSSTTKSSTARTTKTSSTTSTTSKTSTSTRTSSTTSTTKSTSSSISTQRTVTLTTLTSRISTSRPNNGGNTNNTSKSILWNIWKLVIATSVSGGVVLLGLITAGVLFYKKKKQRPTPDKSKPTPPNLIPSTPVSKDDPKPPPTPPNRTPTTPPPPPRPNRSPTPPQTPLNRTPTPPSNRTPTPPPTPPNRTPTPPPNRTPTPLPTPPNRTPTPPLPPPNRTPTPPPTSPNRTPTPPPTPPNRTPTPLPYRTPTLPPTLPNRTPAPLPPPQNRTPTPSPTPPNRSPTPPPTTPNRTPSPPPTTPNRTPTQPLTTPNRTSTPPPTTPNRTPTPPPTTPNRTPSPPPTQLNITPSPKVPEDDPTTTPDKSKVTHIRRISSNMCRRYYKDLLKSLAEDAFLLMIYSEEKNRRRKKRRIKRNLVNPKRL